MERPDVFRILDGERHYQQRRWGRRQADDVTLVEDAKPVEAFLSYMKGYLDEAFYRVSHDATNDATLDIMRKVVTLGIACFEQHGVPERDVSYGVANGHDGLPT